MTHPRVFPRLRPPMVGGPTSPPMADAIGPSLGRANSPHGEQTMSLYGRALACLNRLAGRDLGSNELALMESLEPRVLLDASLPDISDLVDPANTVVRFKTSLGEIDFELYDNSGPGGASAAPITVENFLRYVNTGRYFESFFHRSVNVSSADPDIDGDPFIIQGGGFIFNDEDGLSRVNTFESIANEADPARSNVERSLAMALITSVGTDTATSQFFINLRDNNGSQGALDIDLDAQDFTVFGRVVDDRSWGVVQAIQNLDTFVFADIIVDADGMCIALRELGEGRGASFRLESALVLCLAAQGCAPCSAALQSSG